MTLNMPTPIRFLNLDVCDGKQQGLGGQPCFTEDDLGHFSSLNIFFHILSIVWMNLDLLEEIS